VLLIAIVIDVVVVTVALLFNLFLLSPYRTWFGEGVKLAKEGGSAVYESFAFLLLTFMYMSMEKYMHGG